MINKARQYDNIVFSQMNEKCLSLHIMLLLISLCHLMTLGIGDIGGLCTAWGKHSKLNKAWKTHRLGALAQEADNDQLKWRGAHVYTRALEVFWTLAQHLVMVLIWSTQQRRENYSLQNMLPPGVADEQVTMLVGDFSLFSCSYNRYC